MNHHNLIEMPIANQYQPSLHQNKHVQINNNQAIHQNSSKINNQHDQYQRFLDQIVQPTSQNRLSQANFKNQFTSISYRCSVRYSLLLSYYFTRRNRLLKQSYSLIQCNNFQFYSLIGAQTISFLIHTCNILSKLRLINHNV